MLRVTSIHLGGDGQPASVELEEGATIQDLASAQGLSVDGAVKDYQVLNLMLVVVHADDPENEESVGRTLFHDIFISDRESNLRELKRLVLSAGLPASGGFDTDELIGTTVAIRVRQENYQSKDGEQKTKAVVADFLVPSGA